MRFRRMAGLGPVGLWCVVGLLLCAARPAAAQTVTLFQAQVTPTEVDYAIATDTEGTVDLFHNLAQAPASTATGDVQLAVSGFGTYAITGWNPPNGMYQSWVRLRTSATPSVDVIAGPLQVIVGPELLFCTDANHITPVFGATLQANVIKYTAQVCNIGSRAAGPFRVGVWYNRASAPPPGLREDQFASIDGLDAIWYINSVPPCFNDGGLWGSFAQYFLCTDRSANSQPNCCPIVNIESPPLPNGVYKSWAKADSADFIVEANKANNIAGPVLVNLSLPDIVVTKFEASVNGQTVIFTVDVCNHGTAAASTFYVDVYVDRQTAPQVGYPGDLIQQIDGLAPPQCRHLQFVRGTMPNGTYSSWVLADADNFLTENDKMNNMKGPLEVDVGTQAGCVDNDHDGYYVGSGCTGDKALHPDCNDADPTIHWGAPEICGDGLDNNCNESIDDGCPGVACTDGDGDGWPVGPDCKIQDCDDTDPTVYPGAPEICGDGKDNNCDGIIDDGCPGQVCVDHDQDGYGVGEGCPGPQDCDDNDPSIHPGAAEICGDNKDNNCNGIVDDGCTGCTDSDGDSYGVGDGCGPLLSRDCDDHNPLVHPGAEELCDGIDNNCNGSTDEGCPGVDCVDQDGDGWPVGPDCGPIQDCDDNDPTVYPGAPEICGDGIDQNCNGSIDDGCPGVDCVDQDGDNWPAGSDCNQKQLDCNDADESINPGAPEICGDGIDNNCNGQTDEGCPTCTDADKDGYFVGPDCPYGTPMDCDDTNPNIHPKAPETCQGYKDTNCDGVISKAENCPLPGKGCDCGGAGATPDGGVHQDAGAAGLDRVLLVGFLVASAWRGRPRRRR